MKILLVEDNTGDQLLVQEAFKEAQVECDLYIVNNGLEAMTYLNSPPELKDSHRPDLIILDLNMPQKSGREVLTELKESADLKHIPVLVFSNSTAKQDICSSYKLNASAYVPKPSEFEGYMHFAEMIKGFWINLAAYCPG